VNRFSQYALPGSFAISTFGPGGAVSAEASTLFAPPVPWRIVDLQLDLDREPAELPETCWSPFDELLAAPNRDVAADDFVAPERQRELSAASRTLLMAGLDAVRQGKVRRLRPDELEPVDDE
jgi:hypothetical protein